MNSTDAWEIVIMFLLPKELIALFPKYLSASKLPQEWGNLTHALSGLLCSSLNLLEKPEMVLLPKSILNLARESDTHASWVYGTLSEEPVCTENLTPWLKLLPCRDSKGIASLLSHRPKLYSTGEPDHVIQQICPPMCLLRNSSTG